jgi:Fe-S-cluster-containing hydrogenase component 2
MRGMQRKEVKFMKIKVIKSRCPQNHPCPSVRVCPVDALKQVGFDAPTVIEDKCIKCEKCVKFCPMGAIQLVEE